MINKLKVSVTALLVGVSCAIAQDINPLLPVCRLVGADVVQHADEIPDRYGNTVNYRSATERWNADGWVQTEAVDNTVYTTNPIPTQIQQISSKYKETLEDYFGVGSVTNPAIDRTFVTITLSLDTNVTASTAVRLRAWYEILYGFWAPDDGELDDFPWDQTEYVVTSGGMGHEPYLYVTPIPQFSDTAVGQSSTTTFNLVNARSEETVTGTMSIPAGPFGLVSSPAFSVGPKSIEVITLSFTPTVTGEVTEAITILSDKGNYTPALIGVGTE